MIHGLTGLARNGSYSGLGRLILMNYPSIAPVDVELAGSFD